MQRRFWIVAVLLLSAIAGVAQVPKASKPPNPPDPPKAVDPCQAKPGDVKVQVPLVANSMEPSCEPSRIRVTDRTAVTLMITSVSPVEVCALGTKSQSVTAVTNPLESIINTISAYKSFDFPEQPRVKGPGSYDKLYKKVGTNPDKEARDLFQSLSDSVIPTAQGIYTKQNNQQISYGKDVDALTTYITISYRDTDWVKFDPDTADSLKTAQADAKFPAISPGGTTATASELDWAPLQALIDQMKTLQPRLISACVSAGTECDPTILSKTDTDIEQAASILTILQDNLHSLQTSQTAIAASIAALHKIKVDFDNRRAIGIVVLDSKNNILTQPIRLGTDYGATDSGTLSCSTDTTPAVTTTNTINYSILYQNVPALTVSAGLLISFIEKYEYGVTQTYSSTATPPVSTVFAVTDSARASVVPMAYVNYRFLPPTLKHWWGEPNSEMVISHNLSAGVGLNANTGTSQPEFFAGYAVGFSRSLIHAGLDYGRQQSLGGGFSQGTVPTGFTGTTAPVTWNYKPMISVGISVRIAPF